MKTLELHDSEPKVLLNALNRMIDFLTYEIMTNEAQGLKGLSIATRAKQVDLMRIAERLRVKM